MSPIFIPLSVGSYAIDVLLNMPILGWALVTVFAVGFINALNMADGANGLVPGIAVASFGILVIYLFALLPAQSDLWFGLFAIEVALYLVTLKYLTSVQPKTQYSDPIRGVFFLIKRVEASFISV